VTITFARSLYEPEAVDAAVAAFGELATFEIKLEDHAVIVEIRDPDPDVADVLADELCNHVLSHTITARRAMSASNDG
jgi:hypothetical protein